MILHALTQYYQRKAESDGGVPQKGLKTKKFRSLLL